MDTGAGYSQNISSSYNAEFATYLDYCFFVNGYNTTRSFNGTSWSELGTVNRAPIAKYIKGYGTRLYLANLTINSQKYPSRVWFTDLPYNNLPRWGIEWGTDLVQTASSAVIKSASASFKTYGIKVADPVWILTGANAGEYIVKTVDDEGTITLTTSLTSAATGSSFIIGSNYFDVRTDDNEQLMGLGENSNRLLCFKLNSLYRYNGTSLFQVPGAPGTSSARSIFNVKGYTLYFHGTETNKTGIYMYNGEQVVKVSNPIQPYIDGISVSMYGSVVGWREGDLYRLYVGDITNTQRNISVTKAVITYNVADNKIWVDSIRHVPTCATTFVVNNSEQIFFGDNNATAYLTPSGYDYDGYDIAWSMETGVHYPEGSEYLLKFKRLQFIARDARNVKVKYKLYNFPDEFDTQWLALEDLEHDKTEIKIPTSHSRACGINIKLEENSIKENTQSIEKISIFYTTEGTKFV